MTLAADQAHQTTAAWTKMRDQLRYVYAFGLFHDDDAMLHIRAVNSVSSQPMSVQTRVFGETGQTAGTGILYPSPTLEPFEPLSVYKLLDRSTQYEYITHRRYGLGERRHEQWRKPG